MSLEERVKNGKGNGMLKAAGGIGMFLHSAFHLVPFLGLGYLTLGGGSHEHGSSEGMLHYLIDGAGILFGIWGIYYAYQGIKEFIGYNKSRPAYGH